MLRNQFLFVHVATKTIIETKRVEWDVLSEETSFQTIFRNLNLKARQRLRFSARDVTCAHPSNGATRWNDEMFDTCWREVPPLKFQSWLVLFAWVYLVCAPDTLYNKNLSLKRKEKKMRRWERRKINFLLVGARVVVVTQIKHENHFVEESELLHGESASLRVERLEYGRRKKSCRTQR